MQTKPANQKVCFVISAKLEVGKKIPFVRELGGETFLRRMLSKKRAAHLEDHPT